MVDSFNIALSGMNAASTRLNAAANNIANLDSNPYTPTRAHLTSLPEGQGVETELEPTDQPNDLAGNLLDLQTAHTLYTANAAVVRASDRMIGALLDVVSPNPDPSHRR